MPPRTVSVLKFEGPRTHGMVPALEAFSEFHLTVLAYNSKGPGPESEPYVFHTPEGGEWIQMCIHIPIYSSMEHQEEHSVLKIQCVGRTVLETWQRA